MIERFVVWSARVAACSTWTTEDKARRFAKFWRDMRLLGCSDWRVSRVCDSAAAANDDTLPADGLPGGLAGAPAANEADAPVDRDELLELLTAKDAVIAELRHKLNDQVLSAVREAARQRRHVAYLEDQLTVARRRANGAEAVGGGVRPVVHAVSAAGERVRPLPTVAAPTRLVPGRDAPAASPTHPDVVMLARELKGPLTSLRDAVGFLERRTGGAHGVRDALATMHRQVDQMLRLVDDLLGSARTSDEAAGEPGVGLVLVKRLVELHGGSVEPCSDGPDQDACFVVRLPRDPAARS